MDRTQALDLAEQTLGSRAGESNGAACEFGLCHQAGRREIWSSPVFQAYLSGRLGWLASRQCASLASGPSSSS